MHRGVTGGRAAARWNRAWNGHRWDRRRRAAWDGAIQRAERRKVKVRRRVELMPEARSPLDVPNDLSVNQRRPPRAAKSALHTTPAIGRFFARAQYPFDFGGNGARGLCRPCNDARRVSRLKKCRGMSRNSTKAIARVDDPEL